MKDAIMCNMFQAAAIGYEEFYGEEYAFMDF